MPGIALKLKDLVLDQKNPRISKSGSQREALQKILEDQDLKLVILAESIAEDGLNPMDRWLVVKSEEHPGKYTVLEGNRRLAALMLLNNSAVLNDLEVRPQVKKRFQLLSHDFDVKSIGPIDCFEVEDRAAGVAWLNQRHTGENMGRGIVRWDGVATARFRGSDPALQALEFVSEHGDLTEEEKEEVADRFPISTLDRLLSTPSVRDLIGVDIKDFKLRTDLPLTEIIKPLRRMVLDLAKANVTVTLLKSKDQQVTYVSGLGDDLPNLSQRTGSFESVEGLEERAPSPPPQPAKPPALRKPREVKRTTLIPRDCYFTVSNPKIAEISRELRKLSLVDYPHSIAVLFRVFLETSVDHHLTSAGVALKETDKGGHVRDKTLKKKVEETIKDLISKGTPKNDLEPVKKGIDNIHSPLHIDTLHAYIHSSFHSPTKRELEVAWNNAQGFFMRIWK
jgi:hypothetical protein